MTIRLDFGGEHISFLPDTDGECGCCRRELDEDDNRLSMELARGHDTFRVVLCRACLGEHVPLFLADLDEANR